MRPQKNKKKRKLEEWQLEAMFLNSRPKSIYQGLYPISTDLKPKLRQKYPTNNAQNTQSKGLVFSHRKEPILFALCILGSLLGRKISNAPSKHARLSLVASKFWKGPKRNPSL
jgi:hypothetical protein